MSFDEECLLFQSWREREREKKKHGSGVLDGLGKLCVCWMLFTVLMKEQIAKQLRNNELFQFYVSYFFGQWGLIC